MPAFRAPSQFTGLSSTKTASSGCIASSSSAFLYISSCGLVTPISVEMTKEEKWRRNPASLYTLCSDGHASETTAS
ncbi:hypothetical protein D3C80_1833450 [compost metagenome]